MVNLFPVISLLLLPDGAKNAHHNCSSLHFDINFGTRIDNGQKLCYIGFAKAVTKTRVPHELPRERSVRCKDLAAPGYDTTSEPSVGNSRSGTPVNA